MKKTKEEFDLWNEEKKKLEFSSSKIKKVKRWEIWLAKIWINIGSEISKDGAFERPVLVVSNHMWWDLVWIVPITTKYNKNCGQFLLKIQNYEKYWLNKQSYLCLNHFKMISAKRLIFRLNWFYRWNNKKSLVLNSFINLVLDTICNLNKKHPSKVKLSRGGLSRSAYQTSYLVYIIIILKNRKKVKFYFFSKRNMNNKLTLKSLKKEIENLKQRNKKVELEKSWETSYFRIIGILISTFIIIYTIMYIAWFWDKIVWSLISAIWYLISTFSLWFLKKIYIKKYLTK